MLQEKTVQVSLFKKCSEISIYAFIMISQTKDYRYLIREFDENVIDGTNFTDYINSNELELVYKELEKEYKGLLADKKMLRKEKALFFIMELNTRFSLATEALSLYSKHKEVAILKILDSVEGLAFDEEKDIQNQVKKITGTLFGWKNKLKIMEANFKKKYNVNTEDEDDTKDFISSLDKKALYLEVNLETGYKIDIKKTSVTRWVNLEDMNKQKMDRIDG